MGAHRAAVRYGPGVGLVGVLLALLLEMVVLLNGGLAAYSAVHPLPVRAALLLAGLAFVANAAFRFRNRGVTAGNDLPSSGPAGRTDLTTGLLVGATGLAMVATAMIAV